MELLNSFADALRKNSFTVEVMHKQLKYDCSWSENRIYKDLEYRKQDSFQDFSLVLYKIWPNFTLFGQKINPLTQNTLF